MSSPILALRAALRSILADGHIAIFDEARDAAMPYASFGETSVRIWNDGTTSIAEHKISIHIWSRASGDAEAIGLAGEIANLIETASRNRTDVPLVNMAVTGHEIRRPSREGVRQATLRINAITEHPKGSP